MPTSALISDVEVWSNTNNKEFYEVLTIDYLTDIAISAGLDTGGDIDLIKPMVMSAQSILDIGSGYGRVLNKLVELGYQGSLTGIERSQQYFQYLQLHVPSHIHLIHGDITQADIKQKFDLILWMWTGFCEFTPQEQQAVLTLLYGMLTKGGCLVIDTKPVEQPSDNAMQITNRFRLVQAPDSNASCLHYVPSKDEIKNYAENAGFSKVVHKDYITYTGYPRILNFLEA